MKLVHDKYVSENSKEAIFKFPVVCEESETCMHELACHGLTLYNAFSVVSEEFWFRDLKTAVAGTDLSTCGSFRKWGSVGGSSSQGAGLSVL